MDVQTILGLILGTGGTTLATLLFRFILTLKRGRVETEETLLKRIEKQSISDSARVEAYEARADRAEEETIEYRKRLFAEENRANFYYAHMVKLGIRVPRWPPVDDEDGPSERRVLNE